MPSGPGHAAADHVTFLDHFRGLAILLVFSFHALCAAFGTCTLPWDGWFRNFDVSRSLLAFFPLTYGWVGVPIFFVISGFCIHLSYARSTPLSFQAFFIRRFFRIYPPYLIALILFSTVIRTSNQSIEPSNWLSHALLLHNLSQEFYYAINSSFWSIAVEAQLYLIYPLLVLMAKRWGWTTALIITGLIEGILRAYGTYQGLLADAPAGQLLLAPMWLHQGPLKYWFSWSIGAWIAQRYLDGAPPTWSPRRFAVWLGLLLLAGVFRPLVATTWVWTALATLEGIAYFLSHPPSTQLLASPLIRWLGKIGVISYSLYLLHQPLLGLLHKVFVSTGIIEHLHPILFFGICLAAGAPIAGLAYTMYRLVELPWIARGKQLSAAWLKRRALLGP